MTRDQWLLTGAWAAMAAAGCFSIYKASQGPKLDPAIEEAANTLARARDPKVPKPPAPPTPPRDVVIEFVPAPYFTPPESATRFHPKLVGTAVPPKPCTVAVLPEPVMGEATSTLDGVRLSWSTRQPAVDLLQLMTAVPAKTYRILVMRQAADGAAERIAELGPESRSYSDLSAKPRETYHYWVEIVGPETVRFDRSGSMVQVTNKAERPLPLKTPANTRLKLVGGDRSSALVTVETYDRATKKWVGGEPVLAKPGEKVAGWSLKSLKFDKFTLVADMTDDDGVARVLTTGN